MVTAVWTLLKLSDLSDAIWPFVLLVTIIFFVVLWYFREGRNSVLETQLIRGELGSPLDFHGTLVIVEHRPGSYIRFSKSTKEARLLQLKYRWLLGLGRQATFDEIVFDRSQRAVESKGKSSKSFKFSDFKSIRMREVAGGRGGGSIWHLELIPQKGRAIPFLTSQSGDRKATFENTAPVARAVSAIMEVPAQVFVAGNVWTAGWPPRSATDPKPR
jgi:hypothetical protein